MPLVLRPWNCALSGAADTTIEAYRQRQGDAAEWVARSSGQYLHTDDLLYGGAGPPISNHAPGGERVARAGRWWGDSVAEPRLGSPSIQPKWGLTEFGCGRARAHADIAFVALEFGTHALARGAAVLRDDVWLWRHGDPRGAEAKPIRVALHEHFYPPFSDWQETVLFRSRQVSRQAPEGLTAGRRTLDGPVSTHSRCRRSELPGRIPDGRADGPPRLPEVQRNA